MKNYLKIKTTILLLMTTSITYSQCLINYNNNGTNLTFFAFEELGQGFTSLCDGELEYVQFVANSTGIITAGTLKIYNGNTVNGVPIYTQTHGNISFNSTNPIRIDITGTVNMLFASQYTFQFTLSELNGNPFSILQDVSGGYSNGSGFIFNSQMDHDHLFSVSIKPSTASVNDIPEKMDLILFPNTAVNSIEISGLTKQQNYNIYTMQGDELLKGSVSPNEKISVAELTNGIYFLKINNGVSLKFIKE
ncbi:MAG: T9SS type A sorting domain-containing protein [Crocinitomicaceae bacterium]|nr:T9SS type A sorting domain-containing protein [Crocinitomicaceae bacterium]